MKKNSIFINLLLASFLGLISCGSEEQTTTINQSSAKEIKKAETIEMKNFKEVLIQLTQQRALKIKGTNDNKTSYKTSLFSLENESIVLDPAKQFLLSVGYTLEDLKASNKAIIILAMKVYAEKTQLIINN